MGAVRQAFGKNLAYHREQRGPTQAKLAEMIDSSPSYVGHLERGDREPSLLTIEELARALQIRAGELFVDRSAADNTATIADELTELLRDRSPDDVALVIRLARAAFEHPRLGIDEAHGRQSSASARRAKKKAR